MTSFPVTDFSEAPPTGQKAVLLFWAPWHEASVEGGPMDAVLRALAESSSKQQQQSSGAAAAVQFGRVQAEECPALSAKYGVKVVPTFCLLDETGTVVERIEGGEDVAAVTQAVSRLVKAITSSKTNDSTGKTDPKSTEAASKPPEESLSTRLDRLIRSSEVMLFMKGVPTAPRCGFSRQAVELLQGESIPFGCFDILQDEQVRQGLKTHSDWPTYPQLYVKGELVGGLDIMKEMKQEGSLKEQLGVTAAADSAEQQQPLSLDERLAKLVRRQPVMLFMKGLPSAPFCGFSRQMVEILNEENIAYDSFDILQDEEVRQGLKKFSDWPTYPQLYVNGDLIGGLDIVKEMKADGSLKEALHSK